MDTNEPLLSANEYITFTGIAHDDLEESCIAQEKSRWTSEEIVFDDDTSNWSKLDTNTKLFITHVLSFSVVSDGLVNANLLSRFTQEVTDPSCRRFYLFQAYMEDVHARTYGKMLTSVIMDRNELQRLLHPNLHIQSIAHKIKWIEKWINSDSPFGQRVIAFAIIEGIFFSSLFCAFFWLKQRGAKLPGMIQANELISKDEASHCEFNIKLLKYVKFRLSREEIFEMMDEAVEIEKYFIEEAIPVDLVQINRDTMLSYVKFIANRWLESIPCKEGFAGPLYNNVDMPLKWMETISIPLFASFFEVVPVEYEDSKLCTSSADKSFTTDLTIFED